MYNRKFNTRKDFHELVNLEHRIMPIINNMVNEEEKEILKNYVRKIFDNQYKN